MLNYAINGACGAPNSKFESRVLIFVLSVQVCLGLRFDGEAFWKDEVERKHVRTLGEYWMLSSRED